MRQRGTAVVIVGWHCTHATQRRHGRDSGGAVAAAWGARAIACIGPVDEISGPGASIVPDYFNFSKLLFYFCPNPGLWAVPAPGDALYAGTATMDALCTKSRTPRAAPEACGARACERTERGTLDRSHPVTLVERSCRAESLGSASGRIAHAQLKQR